jgi:hypothetical protein
MIKAKVLLGELLAIFSLSTVSSFFRLPTARQVVGEDAVVLRVEQHDQEGRHLRQQRERISVDEHLKRDAKNDGMG